MLRCTVAARLLLVMAALLAMATAQYYWAAQGRPAAGAPFRAAGFGGLSARDGGGAAVNSVGGAGSSRTRTVRPPVARPFYAPNPVRL